MTLTNRFRIFLFLGCFVAKPIAYAADSSQKPDITISGFLDSYYSYNFNQPKPVATPNTASVGSAAIPPANNTYRYYDSYHNQITLGLAELTVQAKYEDISALVDFDFGSYADLNSQSPYPSSAVVDETSKHIGQAILSYHAKDSRFYFDAGKMYSHLGVETTKSKDNFNYSRSILFSYAMPFWATGAHLGYDIVPERLQASIYIYNGWNAINDINASKTYGAQLKYTPSGKITILYNFIGGAERADSERDWRMVHEANLNWSLSETWALIADFLYGSEANALVGTQRMRAEWYGALIGTRCQVNSVSYLSPRYEIYRDKNGYTLSTAPQTIHSLTLTYGYEIAKGLETRAEARGDFSNENSFLAGSGNRKMEKTLLAALLFKF